MVAEENIFHQNETAIKAGRSLAGIDEEESVVISGIAGVYPNADDVDDFAQKLFDKIDLITDDDRRWKLEHPEIPHRTGKVNVVNKLDASYFGIHYNQANTMDPMCRILLEKTYEAIIDSGTNPADLKGSKVGVFVGACFSESEKTWFYEKLQANGFAVTGCIRSTMANRVSYWLGVDGPSCTIDTACSSSMYAFEYGYRSILEGHCDSAIIGSCNLCLHPYVSLQFNRIGVLSMDGKCKPFDAGADGYCRSEAICAVFLQKKKDAKRIYASIVHAKTNCDGYKEEGITYPSGEIQQQLLNDFYDECEVDPASLAWVEAHGTGTKVGDPEEVKALVNVFCKNRNSPLKIGSVKSNIGHTEPSSGLCSITKVIIAMETGLIPPNINLNRPRTDIQAFIDKKVEVITEITPWDGGMVGVNSFGFGGANCHILMQSNKKEKLNGGLPSDNIPRLVNISGRTEEAVDVMLSCLESRPVDAEYCKLFHDIHKKDIPAHLFRAFTILSKNGPSKKSMQLRKIQAFKKKRPLYFYFPAIYNEYEPLDNSLLQLPVFSETMSKLSHVLAVDMFGLLSKSNKHESNLINHFLKITAIQIAMVDLLKSVGVVPDKYLGSSIGEIVCAYIDGCITAEEAILTSYYIAAALKESDLTSGFIAVVGLSFADIKKLCPTELLDISVINNKATAVMGPTPSLTDFLNSLNRDNVNVKTYKNCGTPIHLNCVKKASEKILNYLQKVLNTEKQISQKWLTSDGKTKCNAEFFCKNIIEPLQSDTTLKQIPEESIVLEIGPKGVHLLSSYIKKLTLFNENDTNNCTSLLYMLGRLYIEGVDMDPAMLYPKVEYPVSRSTPLISPLVRWDHTEDWYVTCYQTQGKINCGERTISITLSDDDLEYISGHVIDGRNLFPGTGYLSLVWETIGLLHGEHYTEVPVIFENVRFHRATNLSRDGSIDFTVTVQKASGNFEVVEGGAAIVTGRAFVPDDISKEMTSLKIKSGLSYTVSSKDFYKELRLRGYNYKGLFRSVIDYNTTEYTGRVKWQNNWVAFMDNMLQLQIIMDDTRGLFVPTSMDRVIIDPKNHANYVASFGPDSGVPVVCNRLTKIIKSGGIEIHNLQANAIPRRKNLGEAVLEKYVFMPNEILTEEKLDLEQIVRIMVQIVLENEHSVNVKVFETDPKKSVLSPLIAQVLADLPLIQPEITILTNPNNPILDEIPPEITVEDKKPTADKTALIGACNDILNESNQSLLESCLYALKDGGFIITREPIGTKLHVDYLSLVASYIYDNEQIMLLRKRKVIPTSDAEIIEVHQSEFDWLSKGQAAMKNDKILRVYFVAQNDTLNGVIGLVNCLRKEPGGTKARSVFILDNNAPKFSNKDCFYYDQLSKDLAVNVYKDGKWGTYRHLLIDVTKTVQCQHAYVNSTVRGDLSSITWLQGDHSNFLKQAGPKASRVAYSALNFRDVMLTTGKLAPESTCKGRFNVDCVIGIEFSGVCNGKRIMGMIRQKGLATSVIPLEHLAWEIPDEWSLAEAATIPVVYGTVIYGLIVQGKMKKGESILIHAGTGGIGQAAINLALHYGLTVYTTCGTPEKKKFLLQNYPQLTERSIGNSRDTSFEQLIMRETEGRGVDLVLNSLAEEKLLASVRCLAKGGRFIEIGKFDLANNNPLNMELFKRGASFYGVMLDNTIDVGNKFAGEKIYTIMLEEIASGGVKPLCHTIFPKNQLETAFRFMAAGKHIGKVMIEVCGEEELMSNHKTLHEAKAKFYAHCDCSYIIAGGLGGFGLELADWLILRGAKNLILTSRKGLSNGYQEMRMNLWKSYGVKIHISTDDITTPEGVVNLLKEAEKLGPIKGIFNLAVVLRDGIFENQTGGNFIDSMKPKALATIHLDHYSRKMCPQLENFVVFSSVSCGRGNAGQTNYGWSNSIMERVCEARQADGLPGSAIQWGAVGDVGLVAEMQDEHIDIVIGGTLQQRITSCLEVLDSFLLQPFAIMSSMVVAEKRAGGSSSDNIVDTVVNILGLRDLKTVSLHSTLAELGMDSMMAVEIKQTLEREFEVFLSPQDIRGMTFAKLYDLSSCKEAEDKKASEIVDTTNQATRYMDLLIAVVGDEPEHFESLIHFKKLPNSSPNNQIFVAPGVEGTASVVEPVALNLNSNVFCIQFDNDIDCDHIDRLSIDLLPKIVERLPQGSKFNLVGYSWGGLIILDLAYRLESLGYVGKLCLVDCSPFLLDAMFDSFTTVETDIQIVVLLRFLDIYHPQDKSKVEQQLREINSWESRVEIVSKLTNSYTTHSLKYIKSILTGVYNRIKAIKKLKYPEKLLSSQIILIRPTDASFPCEEDYNLSIHCKNKVLVHFVEGNHVTILNNKKTADLINLYMASNEENIGKAPLNPTSNISMIKENVKHI